MCNFAHTGTKSGELCPGWYVGYQDELLLCDRATKLTGGPGWYTDLIAEVVRGMRQHGLLREAPCGSLECTDCYLVLDRARAPHVVLDEMPEEARALHAVIFAIMTGEL